MPSSAGTEGAAGAPGPAGLRLYSDLAGWFHLLTAPEDYAEEAEFYLDTLIEHAGRPVSTVLELGSGGGNNASHMKRRAVMTLVDLAPAMVAVSRRLNPECEHVVGDMRSIRLGRSFDAVFVHDAVSYLTSEADLARAVATARAHCAPGGAALFAPDYIAETFSPGRSYGGHDEAGGTRWLRYEQDTRPASGSTYETRMTYRLGETGSAVRVVEETHTFGLFSRRTWLDLLSAAGFHAVAVPFRHSDMAVPDLEVFVGIAGTAQPSGASSGDR